MVEIIIIIIPKQFVVYGLCLMIADQVEMICNQYQMSSILNYLLFSLFVLLLKLTKSVSISWYYAW